MLTKSKVFQILTAKLKNEKSTIFKLLGISTVSSGLVVLQPLLMQRLIDNALIPKALDALYEWIMYMVIIGLLSMAIASYIQFAYTKFSTTILFQFRRDIFEKLFSHQKLFFQKYQTGDLLSRLEGDISEIQRFGTDSVFALTSATLGMIGALVVMFSFNPTLAFLVLFLLPFEFMLLKPLYPKMSDKTRKTRESSAVIGSFMIESLRYILFFRSFNDITNRVSALQSHQATHVNNILSQQKLQILFSQIPALVALLGRIFILVYAGIQVVNNNMGIGELIAFITYFGMILGPIQTYLGIMNALPKVKVSLERLSILLPNQNTIGTKIIPSKPAIVFKNINHTIGQKQLFENMNLSIDYGEKVIIQGDNGSGKSTLFELLLDMQTLQDGEITIANIPLCEIKHSSLYKTFGYVEQHPIVLASTLRDNLLIAKQNATDEMLLNALHSVQLEDWFGSLPYGLDTKLSENGMSLSGGQRQRISIARLILKEPEVILLDEYTSALDYAFAQQIEALIDRLFFDKTRIIISHNQKHNDAKVYALNNKRVQEAV